MYIARFFDGWGWSLQNVSMLLTGRQLFANSFFGRALNPVLPMVVLVSFNHVITLALVQLGIQNNYSNNLSLRDYRGSSDKPEAGQPSELSHEVIWVVWGKLIWCYQTNRIQSLKPSGLEYLYFYGGQGHPLS